MNEKISSPTLQSDLKNVKFKKIVSLLGPFIGLGIIIILFSIFESERFLTLYNFMTVANQTVIVALAAMGMTYIIISGGIDLSVGSVIALVTVVTALMVDHGISPLIAATTGVLSAVICGAVSGMLIGGLGIIPFIATLGMMGIARGVAKWFAGQQKVDAPETWLWELMGSTPKFKWMLVSPGVWLMIVSAVVVTVLLKYSIFGRYTFAIGSNESTARLCSGHWRRLTQRRRRFYSRHDDRRIYYGIPSQWLQYDRYTQLCPGNYHRCNNHRSCCNRQIKT